MKNKIFKNQKGQSLVLVALLMTCFLFMLAIVLDGGQAYAWRRAAQNAADAGALAGAREICVTGDSNVAITRAIEYATQKNQAVTANVSVQDGMVTVETAIPFRTFIGGIIGTPQITSAAIASAGCFAPGAGTGVLPVAWACQPSIGAGSTDFCNITYGDLYIIMDSQDLNDDLYCQDPPNSGTPVNTLDCDYDDDGTDDVYAGGNRSWLDLNGGGGGSTELRDWIRGGFADTLHIHTWLGGQAGVANDVFMAVTDRVGDTVILPVFDQYCEGTPLSNCAGSYHTDDTTVLSGGASSTYFHVISFALFHITCVRDTPGDHCTGFSQTGFPHQYRSIEGYFIEGFVPELSGRPSDGIIAGAYTLYLTR